MEENPRNSFTINCKSENADETYTPSRHFEPSIQPIFRVKEEPVSNDSDDGSADGIFDQRPPEASDDNESGGQSESENILEPSIELTVGVKDEPVSDYSSDGTGECTDAAVPESAAVSSMDEWKKRGRLKKGAMAAAPTLENLKGSEDAGQIEGQRGKLRKRFAAVSYHEDSVAAIKPKRREWVQCPRCNKEFEKRYLKLHLQKHTGERPHACDICQKPFFTRYSVKVHKERCHGVKGARNRFHCDICGGVFCSKHVATEHRRTHTGEKPYRCTTCDGQFSHKASWKSHMRTHDPGLARVFQCQQCDKVFKQKDGLKRHEDSVHRGIRLERVYECSACGLSCNTYYKFRVHQRKHTGEQTLACTDCDKRFKTKRTLRDHMLIHQGVKPYQCKICGKRFRQSTTLKRHQLVHTCNVCSKHFARRVDMRNHECFKKQTQRGNKTAATEIDASAFGAAADDATTAATAATMIGNEKSEPTGSNSNLTIVSCFSYAGALHLSPFNHNLN